MRLGLDIGGTKTDAVALDDDGAIVDRVRLATGFGADAVIRTALDGVERIAAATGLDARQFASIGVGIPGQVDAARGTVSHAVNLGFDELDVGGLLSALLGREVKVENDVKAAALGAYRLLTSMPHAESSGEPPTWSSARSLAYLNLGTGLAAGHVIEGALWRGARGAAGEIGHIPFDPAGALCPCGQRGCLETVASGSAIARQWATDDPYPVRSLLAAADGGHAAAIGIRDRFVDGVAAAVRMLVLTLDVEIVMIGGGLSNLGSWLLDEVRRVLSSWAEESPFLGSLGLDERVLLVPAGFPAAAVGAALVGSPSAPEMERIPHG
jgi:predicted NBD/HSP70 family sugar kinase